MPSFLFRFRFRRPLLIATAAALLLPAIASAQTSNQKPPQRTWWQRFLGIHPDLSGGWLYVGYKGDSHDGLYFAVSKDGSRWETINFDRPVFWQEQRGELMREPFIQRTPDGNFRMVWIWSNSPAAIGYSTSSDLIHWSKQLRLPVAQVLPSATTVATPATYYDPEKKDWLLLFTASETSGPPQDRIYATTTPDFKNFEPAKPFSDKHPGADPAPKTVPTSLSPGSLLHLETPEYNLLHNYHGGTDTAESK